VDVELEAEAEVQTVPIFAVQTTPHGLKEVIPEDQLVAKAGNDDLDVPSSAITQKRSERWSYSCRRQQKLMVIDG
jgi:hypothetical protein